MGTGVNIYLLIQKIREDKKNNGNCTIFIDFKSAYNTVIREQIYERLIEKKILQKDEV